MSDEPKFQHSGWLWAVALVILIVGGTATFLLSKEKLNPRAQKAMIVCLAGTVIGTGICVIAATSDWWLQK